MRKLLVVLIVAAFMIGFAVPAMSQPPPPPNISDAWSIDGRAAVRTSYTDKSEERTGTGYSDADLEWAGRSARVRVQYKTDALTGFVEIAEDNKNAIFKNYYGEMNMGSWFLMVGYFDPISFNPADGPAPDVTVPVGVALGHKKGGMLRGRFPLGMMTLTVALIEPEIKVAGPVDSDTTLPAVEVKADFVTGGIPWAVWGGYQTYDMVDAGDVSESLDSYIVGGVVRPKVGPVMINASFFMEQNNYSSLPPFSYPVINPSWGGQGTAVNETSAWGAHASAGWVFSPMFALWAGLGMASADDDANNEMESMCYYASLPIQMNPNFRIIPYITFYDAGDNVVAGVNQGDRGTETTFGAYWEVKF